MHRRSQALLAEDSSKPLQLDLDLLLLIQKVETPLSNCTVIIIQWMVVDRWLNTFLKYSLDEIRYLQRVPVWHCVPLKPGAQLQLNPFTRSVQVPLFLQGWLAQSSMSISEDKMKRTKLKYSMVYLRVRNKNSNKKFLCALLTQSHHHNVKISSIVIVSSFSIKIH